MTKEKTLKLALKMKKEGLKAVEINKREKMVFVHFLSQYRKAENVTVTFFEKEFLKTGVNDLFLEIDMFDFFGSLTPKKTEEERRA